MCISVSQLVASIGIAVFSGIGVLASIAVPKAAVEVPVGSHWHAWQGIGVLTL